MYIIILILALIGIFFIWKKSYRIELYRTITAYTGGVGSGKTFMSVRQAIKCYQRALSAWRKQRIKAVIMRREVPEKPLLFSNIPIMYKKKFTSCELTPDILLLQRRIPEGSVVLIDEVSAFLNQFEYAKNNNVKLFDEFCRLCRQYFNGNVIINDQCSSNIVLQIRRRLNTIYNLSKHRYFFGVTMVKVREINISDEILSVDTKDTNNEVQTLITFGNFFKHYESRCYRYRYEVLDGVDPVYHDAKFTTELLTCPDTLFENVIDKTLHPQGAVPTVSAMPKASGNVDEDDLLSMFDDDMIDDDLDHNINSIHGDDDGLL